MDKQAESDQVLFNDIFPVPFKVLFLIQLGLILWYSLVWSCTRLNINIMHLLNLSYSPHNYSLLDHLTETTGEFHASIPPDSKENHTLLEGILSNLKPIVIVNTASWVVFKWLQGILGGIKNGESARFSFFLTPTFYLLPMIAFLHLFYRLFYKRRSNTQGQFRMYTTVKRILLGKINSVTMRTNDILISDSLMSYSKVLNDFALFIWKYYYSAEIPYNTLLEFSVLCIPMAVRMKQCWQEYSTTRNKQHLLNFIKYASGLGPMVMNLLIKRTITSYNLEAIDDSKKEEIVRILSNLNRWWYVFSFINSAYSLVWDIKMDWGLQMFDGLFKKHSKTTFLRPQHQLYYNKLWYYFVIWCDVNLRFIWVLRLFIIQEELNESKRSYLHIFSTFLFGYDAFSFGYAVIEVLEIFRRWLWCFLKLESDWVKLQDSRDRDIELTTTKRG